MTLKYKKHSHALRVTVKHKEFSYSHAAAGVHKIVLVMRIKTLRTSIHSEQALNARECIRCITCQEHKIQSLLIHCTKMGESKVFIIKHYTQSVYNQASTSVLLPGVKAISYLCMDSFKSYSSYVHGGTVDPSAL